MTSSGSAGMSRTVWFYAEGDQAAGPVSWDGLLAAARRQDLTPAGRVWTPAVDAWVPAGEVPWLFGTAAPEAAREPGAGDMAVPPPLKGTRFAYARPPSPITRLGLEAARPWRRLGAFVIDSLAVILLAAAIGRALHWFLQSRNLITPDVVPRDIIMASAAVLLILYHVAVESFWGTSLGKRATACRVIDAYGETPFASRVVIRSVVRALTAVGILVAGISVANGSVRDADLAWFVVTAPFVLGTLVSTWVRDRRALHDFAGGTWVVRRSPSTRPDTQLPKG